MPPILGAVADDLTGGMELASMLVGKGADCAFVTDAAEVPAARGADAIVVARKIRTIAPERAVAEAEAAARALLAAGCRQLFFKYCATFDSTDRGNIGPVADRLADIFDARAVPFCPSFPEVGRTVFHGHLFVGQQLVSDSPKRFDPLTPMNDPRLVDVLQRQSRRRVGLLAHRHVRAGVEAMRREVARLEDQGFQHLIVDAICPDDLAAIAALTVDWPIVTGNSSVGEYLPENWARRGWFKPRRRPSEPAPVGGAAAVLAGSCAERTLEQLDTFARHRPVLRINLEEVASAEEAVTAAVAWAGAHLGGGPVAIATSAPPDAVARIQGKHGREGAAALAEAILGRLAVALREMGVRRFLVAGGETSGNVVEELGVRRLQVGAYKGPGIALAATEGEDRVGFCLKSGKLGPVDMFLPALAMMGAPTRVLEMQS